MIGSTPEHTPMIGLDEYLIHNYPLPLRVHWTDDPRAYERVMFTCQDDSGDLLVVCGLGFYPNLGTAEAYCIVNCRGRHTTVRAHRKLGDDRTDMTVGPIRFEIVEPFRQWRITLDDNDFGVTFDIGWHDTKRAVFRTLGAGVLARGKAFSGVSGYEAFGRQDGWVKVNGETFSLSRETYCGMRDHNWGQRDGVGGPPDLPPRGLSGPWVEFDDVGVWSDELLFNLGDERPGIGHGRRLGHRLRFDESGFVTAGETDIRMHDGATETLRYRRLGNQIAFLRCGMYGGTPDGNVWQGQYVGHNVVSGETYDANDPAVRQHLGGMDVLHMIFDRGGERASGLLETAYPGCRDLAAAGAAGLRLLSE